MVLFHKVRYVLGNKKGYLFLIFMWISMEYLHLNWELNWYVVNTRKCVHILSKSE